MTSLFVIIKPAPCRLSCSAIKIGEYWANGLPVLLTPSVGDDSAIIAAENGGTVFDLSQPGSVPAALMKQPDYRVRIHALAVVLPKSWTIYGGYLSQRHEPQTHSSSLHC